MKICIFGDSIAWGAVDPLAGGWVGRLKRFLDKKDQDIDLYNLSMPGNTTQDLLRRFKWETLFRQPEVIIFAIGINNSVRHSSDNSYVFSLEESSQQLRQLLKQAQKHTQQVIFIGLTNVDEKKTRPMFLDKDINYDNQRIKAIDQIIAELARKENLPYCPLFGKLAAADLLDGLHPNRHGHQKIYRFLKAKLLKILTDWQVYQT